MLDTSNGRLKQFDESDVVADTDVACASLSQGKNTLTIDCVGASGLSRLSALQIVTDRNMIVCFVIRSVNESVCSL